MFCYYLIRKEMWGMDLLFDYYIFDSKIITKTSQLGNSYILKKRFT